MRSACAPKASSILWQRSPSTHERHAEAPRRGLEVVEPVACGRNEEEELASGGGIARSYAMGGARGN